MLILLSGKSGIGKSTILSKLNQISKGELDGILAQEILDSNCQRLGFAAEILNRSEKPVIFAEITRDPSRMQIGEFSVELEAIDRFIVPQIESALQSGRVTIIDEIGRMQMLSPSFRSLTEKIVAADSLVIATIVHDPEPWSLPIKNHPNAVVITVDTQNRNALPGLLLELLPVTNQLKVLSRLQLERACKMLARYFNSGSVVSIQKFAQNTLRYMRENRMERQDGQRYLVHGDHGDYTVTNDAGEYQCNCPVASGAGNLAALECSHIQLVQLSK